MNRDDWEHFDELFIKEGYGGYYDFVECLRMYARAWAKDLNLGDDEVVQLEKRLTEAKTLHNVERTLMRIYYLHKKKHGENTSSMK